MKSCSANIRSCCARDAEGTLHAAALLGLDAQENLFLSARGWEGRYVPALLQRGPFSIGVSSQGPNGEPVGEPMIHIDLDHPRISREEGPAGLPAPGRQFALSRSYRGRAGAIFEGVEVDKTIFTAFEDYGLIEPIQIEIKVSEDAPV